MRIVRVVGTSVQIFGYWKSFGQVKQLMKEQVGQNKDILGAIHSHETEMEEMRGNVV